MAFHSDKFKFNDIGSREMGVILVSFDSGVLMDYGVAFKEALQSDVSKNNHFYYEGESESEPIRLNLVLVDDAGVPCKWDLENRIKVIDWMVTKEFCPFVSEDDASTIHYLKCVEYTRKFNHRGEGAIEFVMQPESPYVYTPIIEHVYHVEDEKFFSINSLDNVNERYYPKVEIIQLDKDGRDIVIQNISTTTEPFIIKNLQLNEKVEIDFLLKSITSDIEKFKLKDVNKKWIYFKRGMNDLKIEGYCDVRFTTQYPLKV